MKKSALILLVALSLIPPLQADEGKTSVTLTDGSTPSSDSETVTTNPQVQGGNVYHGQVAAGLNESLNRKESPLKHSQGKLHKKLDQIKEDSKVRLDSINQKIHDADQKSRNSHDDRLKQIIAYGKKKVIDLNTIPDPDNPPFQSKLKDKLLRSQLNRTYLNLYKIDPKPTKQKEARDLGIASILRSEKSFEREDHYQGHFFKELAVDFLDIAIGIDPVSGLGRSAYELIYGKNLITQATLSSFERTIAFAGVVTLGGGRTAYTLGKEMVKLAQAASHVHLGPVIRSIELLSQATAQAAHILRETPGSAIMSTKLYQPEIMMRGTHLNAGLIPKEVGEKLVGREFKNFNAFRKSVWKEISHTQYGFEFINIKRTNLENMMKGLAPTVDNSQKVGKSKSFQLHHIVPINQGGHVYDVSNIMIVTPRFHYEVLTKEFHYGK